MPGQSRVGRQEPGREATPGNVYLRRILCEIAHAAARTQDGQFGPYKQRLAKRRGTGGAVVATAHKVLRTCSRMLRDDKPYCGPQIDH